MKGGFFLQKTEAQKLVEILSDIEKQRFFRIFGYILIPIILGFFILKKTNKNICILTKKKDKVTYNVINELETSNEQLKNTLNYLTEEDFFLIYPVRTDLLNKLKEYETILHHLKLKNENFENFFNDIIETSINNMLKSKIKIENFNKELIERRKKEYEFLFKKSNSNLNDEQKTAIITDDRHNLIVAGAGSGKTEVLITRIAYIVQRKQETIAPNRILALAFQNKAAKEIEERLSQKFGIKVRIKTFHSFGLEVLSNALLKPKLKFNGDNFESEYYKFMVNIYEKIKKEPTFQNKLLEYMLLIGDEDFIKQESDFEKK
jgi:DNA helicase-4